MKHQHTVITLLALALTACASAQPTPSTNATDTQNTAIAVIGTGVAFTQAALPTATLDATPTIIIPTMTLSSAQLTVLATTPDPTQEALEQEIKSVIQAYFEIRYQALSVEKPDGFRLEGFGDLVSDSPEAKTFLETELGKLAIERKHNESNQLLYIEYEYFLDFENITLDASSQNATVSVVEGYAVVVENSEQYSPNDPIVSRMANREHTIMMCREQGQWKIVSDNYEDNIWRMLRQSGISAGELLLTMQAPTKTALTPSP